MLSKDQPAPALSMDAEKALERLDRVKSWHNGKGGILPYDFLFGTDKRDTPDNCGYINLVENALRTTPAKNTGAVMKQMAEALEAAHFFIRNGIELGFIRMPDKGVPDPASLTPDKVEKALAAYAAIEKGE